MVTRCNYVRCQVQCKRFIVSEVSARVSRPSDKSGAPQIQDQWLDEQWIYCESSGTNFPIPLYWREHRYGCSPRASVSLISGTQDSGVVRIGGVVQFWATANLFQPGHPSYKLHPGFSSHQPHKNSFPDIFYMQLQFKAQNINTT